MVPGSAKSAGGDHPRAPPCSGESAVAQHLAPHQVTPARELPAPRLVRVTCGPGRTPPSALRLLRPFPHAPCPAGDSAGHWRCPGRARPGWRRGETQAPAPARVRSSLSLSICPTGPWRGGGGDWQHPGVGGMDGWVGTVSALPATRAPGPGGVALPQAPPHSPPSTR